MLQIIVASSPVQAEFKTGLIDADFEFAQANPTQSGSALIGSVGDHWNSVPPNNGATTALSLANGSASQGVTLRITGIDNTIAGGSSFSPGPYAALMSEFFVVSPGNTMTLSLGGLTALQPYDLYFYSQGASTDLRNTNFTIAGTSKIAASNGASASFIEGGNFVHFGPQSADAAGNLTITVQGSAGSGQVVTSGVVNGFQIAPVPEPATLVSAFVCLAVCGGFAYKFGVVRKIEKLSE